MHNERGMCIGLCVCHGSMRDANCERWCLYHGTAMRFGQLRRWRLLQHGVHGALPSVYRSEKRQWFGRRLRSDWHGIRPRQRMHDPSGIELRTNWLMQRRWSVSALCAGYVLWNQYVSRNHRHGPNLQWHGSMRHGFHGPKLRPVRVLGRRLQESLCQFQRMHWRIRVYGGSVSTGRLARNTLHDGQ